MGNIVKNTDNRGGTIIQTTTIQRYTIESKRWIKKTFQAKKYYQAFDELLQVQLNKKIQIFKNNKKYIPEIFLELDKTKEDLRYIVQPILFYNKNI